MVVLVQQTAFLVGWHYLNFLFFNLHGKVTALRTGLSVLVVIVLLDFLVAGRFIEPYVVIDRMNGFIFNLAWIEVSILFRLAQFAHNIARRRFPGSLTEFHQPFLHIAGIIHPDHTKEYKVGNNAQANRSKNSHVEPKHGIVADGDRADRNDEKPCGNDQHDNGRPEIFYFMKVYVIIFLLQILYSRNLYLIVDDERNTGGECHVGAGTHDGVP